MPSIDVECIMTPLIDVEITSLVVVYTVTMLLLMVCISEKEYLLKYTRLYLHAIASAKVYCEKFVWFCTNLLEFCFMNYLDKLNDTR